MHCSALQYKNNTLIKSRNQAGKYACSRCERSGRPERSDAVWSGLDCRERAAAAAHDVACAISSSDAGPPITCVYLKSSASSSSAPPIDDREGWCSGGEEHDAWQTGSGARRSRSMRTSR